MERNENFLEIRNFHSNKRVYYLKFWNTEILNLSLVRKILIIINIFRCRNATIRNFPGKKSMIFFTIINF